MKTVFDPATRHELINRINTIQPENAAQWGRMNVHQMLRHCILWDEMILQNKKFKRPLIGLLLGKMMLRKELKDDRPMRKNNPTVPELIIKETLGDFEGSKIKWISLINEYSQYAFSDLSFVHPFFGKMTKEQIGFHAYKHTDHHLRQFNS